MPDISAAASTTRLSRSILLKTADDSEPLRSPGSRRFGLQTHGPERRNSPFYRVTSTFFLGATAVSGTRIGSRDPTISARRSSNHGGIWSLVPSSSLVSSFSNEPGALQQLS